MLADKYGGGVRIFEINSDDASGSRLEAFDLAASRRDPQHKRLHDLETYCERDTGVSPSAIQGEIRKLLEGQLKFKCFKLLAGETTLGCMLDELQQRGLFPIDLREELRELNRVSSPSHHGKMGAQPLQELCREEVIPYIRRAVAAWYRI